MNVGVLECEYIGHGERHQSERPGPGSYTALFRDMLDPVLKLTYNSSAGSEQLNLVPLDVRVDGFPRTVYDYDAFLVTGSYSSVYDDERWIHELLAFIRRAHAAGTPLVGICFGHQAIAHALGGRTARAPGGWGLGVHSTTVTHGAAERYTWMHGTPVSDCPLVYMHRDQVMEVPAEAEVFAGADHCRFAGFTIGDTVLSMQGHPEFTLGLAESLIRADPETYGVAPSNGVPARGGESEPAGRRIVAEWIVSFLRTARGAEVDRLATAVGIRTVSTLDDATANRDEFDRFEAFLEQSFPLVHRNCTRERPGDPGLLYTWSGSDTSLDPLLFLAHYDVVPADDPADDVVPADDPPGWTHPPFSGHIENGCVWGRGTLDDKSSLLALLEAVERLLADGYLPVRTLLFAFGGDEEVTGRRGAASIAAHLRERGITVAATLDEGAGVVEQALPFLDAPVALIGIAEKGYLDVELVAREAGGHAAMPERRTALSRVASAVHAVMRRRFPARLTPSVRVNIARMARAGHGPRALLMRAPRFLAPLVRYALASAPRTDAMIRTTQAPTTARGSAAANVLPSRASIGLNIRILPGETRATTIAHLARRVRKWDVTVEELPGGNDPIPDSSTDTPVYRAIQHANREFFPGAVNAPYLVTATTDSRHYRTVSRNIYRFAPLRFTPAALRSIHGVDERICARDYRRAIAWYQTLLRSAGGNSDD